MYSAAEFKKVVKALSLVNEEISFEFDAEGLHVCTMDPSHVGMVKLDLPVGYFDRWAGFDGRPSPWVVMSVDVGDMLKMLKRVTKADSVRLVYDPGVDEDKGFLWLTDRSRDFSVKKTFPVLEGLGDEVPTPKIFFKAKARILSGILLKKVLPNLGDVSGHCSIGISTDVAVFKAVGDLGGAEVLLGRDNDNVLEIRCDEASKSTFEVDRLLEMFKGLVPLSEVVTLSLSDDMPVEIDAELPQGTLVYHLAPCVGI